VLTPNPAIQPEALNTVLRKGERQTRLSIKKSTNLVVAKTDVHRRNRKRRRPV
jgi:hypothetical protein